MTIPEVEQHVSRKYTHSVRGVAELAQPQLSPARTRRPVLRRAQTARPAIRGKYFFANGEKLWIRGVTYGAFRADDNGLEYYDSAQIDRDFAQMAASGINAVRIPHTTPPRGLLDIASDHNLRVMVGLSAEQFAGDLIDREKAPDIDSMIRKRVRSVAGHPALLSYGLGNEIQAPVARWIGRRRLEQFLERIYSLVKREDPDGLVTYVNYPSTEYLTLPFLDFHCCNVYLESEERLGAYLSRLQNIAGDRPLVMGELGLDSMRNGEGKQAEVLDWQVRTSFKEGCAGTFVFSWTDEWYRGKERVEDWAFGLTRADRSPKPSLGAVSRAFAEVPFPDSRVWPTASVVVCTHNAEATLPSCLDGLAALDYPDYEVIVVNDGSTDSSGSIAESSGAHVVTTQNMGLSSARNTGLHAATGEIVAYIDDDATPDPHWLKYLADSFRSTSHDAVGGPNIPPGDGGVIADAVENAPGGPMHVLISDREAEHVPGCNMAFRRDALLAIGGFDPQFRSAGDDVDVCWRLLERGSTIGFNHGAMVTHHRRKSVRTFWRQQWGYGRAEAQLEKKWPEKYNSVGHVAWAGRLYGKGLTRMPGSAGRVFHGVWGVVPFQLLYQPASAGAAAIPLMPEWYLVQLMLLGLSVLGLFWPPLLYAIPLFLLAFAESVFRAGASASAAEFPHKVRNRRELYARYAATSFLYLIQPAARLGGRIRHGLNPFRSHDHDELAMPWPRGFSLWTDHGLPQEARLSEIEGSLRQKRTRVVRGGAYDSWDLEVLGGLFGGARLRMAVEEHGSGHQYVRIRYWPHLRRVGGFIVLQAVLLALATLARADGAQFPAAVLTVASLGLTIVALRGCATAVAAFARLVAPQREVSPTTGDAGAAS